MRSARPIADVQAARRRRVDAFVQSEPSTSTACLAKLKLAAPAAERARAVPAAKAFIGKALTFTGQAAVQTHGGVGLTEELALSHDV